MTVQNIQNIAMIFSILALGSIVLYLGFFITKRDAKRLEELNKRS